MLSIHFGLRLFSFHFIYRIVNPVHGSPYSGNPANGIRVDQIIWAVNRAGYYLLGRDSCLRQALTGQFFFNQAGVPATLRIGVKKQSDGSLLAHAWIEKDGQILIGGSDERINRFQQFHDLDQAISQEQIDQHQ